MKNFNENKVFQGLSQQTWNHIYFYKRDSDSLLEIWKHLFLEAVHKHAPIQQWLAITLCSFPNDQKTAKIIPLFENGKRNISDNYRPIAVLLPAISKVMERKIYNQLCSYFSANGLFSEHQVGFCRNHSTTTALLDRTNEWYVNVDRKLLNLEVSTY